MKREKEKIISVSIIRRKISVLVLAIFSFAPFLQSSAQKVEPTPQIYRAPFKQILRVKPATRQNFIVVEDFTEKSILVDQKINISLCISEGNLKITGWDRNEIRAFVSNGSALGFDVREKNKQNNPVWLKITGFDETKKSVLGQRECLSAEQIELDVPRGATVNVKSRTSETKIEAIRKVVVENVGGDIFLNHIEQGITASTLEGDVTVENSGGAITLNSGNGNILAFDIAPVEIGDIFKAKTFSGSINLQQIAHRQTEVNSNSGAIKFVGELLNGGQYNFGTQNGSLTMAIPEKSSCNIRASYGFGSFSSEITLQNIVKNNASKTQSLTALLGSGDASVNLTTYSGSIRFKKQ